ncbi:hypothetical protein K461DRAFT_288963 [Myriangium duriaei CBS 260.36]|uniref:Protection of telomeres protein 1 n=1 Tax=Myriangium duriaei CBS 260.36 TaxID=1168546 RepID=A0A9P4JCY1_9PEZI|nr:hypothetical protein K461DRAFT_288963 [Myriangium duriaei CBS 260.36]
MSLSDRLPDGYMPLSEAAAALPKAHVNVIGFVTDVLAPTVTHKNEWTTTFSLCDDDTSVSIQIRFFRILQADLPEVQLGDIVILKDIVKTEFRQATVLLSSWGTSSMVFKPAMVPDPGSAVGYTGGKNTVACTCRPPSKLPTIQDQIYVMFFKKKHGGAVKELVAQQSPVQQRRPSIPIAKPGTSPVATKVSGVPSGSTIPTGPKALTAPKLLQPQKASYHDKFSLIENVRPNTFNNLVVEVVKIFARGFGDYAEVYVTDFTTHNNLYDYPAPEEQAEHGRDGDVYGYTTSEHKDWPGPFGQRTICVEVRQPHLHYIQSSVKVGDCIEMKNVRVKMGHQGRLEANLFPDQRYPERIYVNKIFAPKSKQGEDLLERKSAYWSQRGQPPPKQESNKQKKKRKKAAEAARTAEAAEEKARDVEGGAVNKYVRCAHKDVPLSMLSTMLSKRGKWKAPTGSDEDLPFVNHRRRCQLKVVDFYPLDLADFASPSSQAIHASRTQSDDEMDIDPPEWEWHFFLLVQDAVRPAGSNVPIEQMWLHVSNDAAQYLLNLDACDLRQDSQALNQLCQKIDILCGNLRELKTDQNAAAAAADALLDLPVDEDRWSGKLSNIPFDCCIEEYGQPLDDDDRWSPDDPGWIRLFAMFETTIL